MGEGSDAGAASDRLQEMVQSGNAYLDAGETGLASQTFRKALEIDSNQLDCLLALSMQARTESKLEDAADYLSRLVALRPHVARYRIEFGRVLYELRNYAGAEAEFRAAIQLAPRMVWAHLNLGIVLLATQRLEEAEEYCRNAVKMRPDMEWTHLHLASVLRAGQRIAEAEASCHKALRIRPDFARAHALLGNVLLVSGRLQEGWPEFEWHRKVSLNPGTVARADGRTGGVILEPWKGDEFSGGALLVEPDGGLGDIIQFCRYVPLITGCDHVILRVPRVLERLLSTLAGSHTLITENDETPCFDIQCAVTQLPAIFRTKLDTIPAAVPYLRADERQIVHWRNRISGSQGINVGLVWAGGNLADFDSRRSIPIDQLSSLWDVQGVNWISLQKGAAATQVQQLRSAVQIQDWTEELRDFADTAALVEALDVIVTVDTAVAHLAGALGKTVWLMNRYDTCWRWLLERNNSPWYPTLTQFRQPRAGDWGSVVAEVAHVLQMRSAASSPKV